MTSLAAATMAVGAVSAVRDTGDRISLARRAASMVDGLDQAVDRQTVLKLWVRLGRAATRRPVLTVDKSTTVEQARAACLAALDAPSDATRWTARGRPRKDEPGTRRTTVRFPPDLYEEIRRAAAAGGLSVNDEIIRRCAADVTEET